MLHNHVLVAILIFSLTYTAIISEKINRTVIAMFGAVLMIIFQVISQEHAFGVVDYNTIGLLIGMMIIVNILKKTGIFQYVAIKTAKVSKGDPWRIIVYFTIITAISSALLDNVTTILLIAPVTFVITDTLEINPIPFMIAEILSANIGGTATLIGDPPNIMIGGATGLGFMDFLMNLAPVVLVIFVVTILLLKVIFKKSLQVKEGNKNRILDFDETKTIKDKVLLIKSLIVLGLTITGFAIHQFIGLESATVALFGGTFLLLISNIDPEEVLIEIEWTTIFFFIGLFVLVGALEEVGVIGFLAEKMIDFTKGDLVMTTMLILWLSAIASSFLDNIPFVATMIPLIKNLAAISSINVTPLWWALALGACLGGNGTLVGASANVIVGGMLEKQGHKLSFMNYMKVGFPLTIISIIISTIYLMVFYI
ncbi:ArsB/NhaD family transporter [Paramaledivibacter caminithermalis]|uniref:Possible tyrosine transporter P-protein (TC 2.A.45.2.1) n=1 Tax=Paramaledivibacter caminithermalis (strain DSM 15212 / CIP 107654 / DViRD3) TaxID=1121301 RepID=A0A1M6SG87_PARC5|nr:ArsB/NhaD family transporter [Paramaledivibacter caminithermalis]SHK43751.1 possible tyrosine transporter P-protein (TC 2.A.45.2.1) [Paramaledivibacter caminithermalis DSM 15212]